MRMKKRLYIAIGVITLLLVGLSFWGQERKQVQIQARIQQAKVNTSNATDAFRRSLEPAFKASQELTIKASCKEDSPDLSFTRLYDCNAIVSIELSSVQAISTAATEALLKSGLSHLGADPASLDATGSYAQIMDEDNSWHTQLPIDIPQTAIAGVPPFNYYGGVGQENVGLQLTSKSDQANPKKTVITVTATQEYNSCKSLFLPCVSESILH